MAERGYAISKDKVAELYKELQKKQQGLLYVHMKQQENRYKDIYYISREEKGAIYCLNALYKQGVLVKTEEELYTELNAILATHNQLPINLVVQGLEDINKVSQFYLKKYEPELELKVQKGEDIVPTSEWQKLWNKFLKIAVKNKGKMGKGATLASLYFDNYLRFGNDGRLFLSQTHIGSYQVKTARYKNNVVCVLYINVGGNKTSIILGYDKKKRSQDKQQDGAIKAMLKLTDNTKGVSLADLKVYSEDFYDELELTYLTDEDGEVYFDNKQVILGYLSLVVREYGVQGYETYIRNITITETQILYKKQPIADYEITMDLDDSKYPINFYEVTLHIEFINSEATNCIIGYYEYTESEELVETTLLREEDDVFEDLDSSFGEDGDDWEEYDDNNLYQEDYAYATDFSY